MRPYRLLAPGLLRLPAETSHQWVSAWLRCVGRLQIDTLMPAPVVDPLVRLGLHFPNRVGLAAGADKNAECVDGWAALGFGFVEVGTVTPEPQPGNARPRLFRIRAAHALINRMGFNNQGLEHLRDQLARCRYRQQGRACWA